jgi:N-acetylmuramoyl-L-alanine amidase
VKFLKLKIFYKETRNLRIANRKRFTFSCIFFTFVLSIFGKGVLLFREDKFFKGEAPPIVMAVDKNKKPGNREGEQKNRTANKNYVIVLDAGHGGVDFGTSYNNLNEKDLTFKIVKYIEGYLKDQGRKA